MKEDLIEKLKYYIDMFEHILESILKLDDKNGEKIIRKYELRLYR